MHIGLYTIYDRVAEEAGPVFQAINDGVALRNTVQVLKPLSPTLRDEYQLIKVGSINTKTMELTVEPPREIDYSLQMARADEFTAKGLVEVENE